MTMLESEGLITNQWRKLSAWSICHFAAQGVIRSLQGVLAIGVGAYGVSRTDVGHLLWLLPGAIIVLVLVGSLLSYLFFRFRVTEEAVQVRSGALLKRDLNLSFERIQNINLVHPFYFRPLGLVTLKIDGAGATGDEVSLAALHRHEAEDLRAYIVDRRHALRTPYRPKGETPPQGEAEAKGLFFTRSLPDLVLHGLTNNRALLAIAGLVGVLLQTNLLENTVEPLVARFGAIMGSFSLVRLALLFVIALIIITGLLAALSVLVSIVTYYGFGIRRTDSGLTIQRGLFTRHEINLRQSRIQTVTFQQDWLDYLLGRRNIMLEQISHALQGQHQGAAAHKRILVPSVRLEETDALLEEVLPGCRVDALPYAPISKRYFYKQAIIRSAVHALALMVPLLGPGMFPFYAPLVLLLWPPHMAYAYLRWKRAGIAVDGDLVVVRSGAVGIDYQAFPAFKAQDVTHIQSILMQRRDLSTLVFHTASSTLTVPYLPTGQARQVVDYCLYQVETSERSWM